VLPVHPRDFLETIMRKLNVRSAFKEQVLRTLAHIRNHGPQTYGELESALESAGTYLTREHIAEMRRDGFITRELASIEPVVVQYALTTMGASLAEHATGLVRWIDLHREDIHAARDFYSQATARAERAAEVAA
jgi:DNA-binding HxlR family transcriptional regulator